MKSLIPSRFFLIGMLILALFAAFGCSQDDDDDDEGGGVDDDDDVSDDDTSQDDDDTADDDDDPGFDFTVVALPDTQTYAKNYPEIFYAQVQWIVDNAEKERIAFVTHLGDIVNNVDQPDQWLAASEAMYLLDDAGIPYGTALGNHDVYKDAGPGEKIYTAQGCSTSPVEPCDAMDYINYFNPTRYEDEPWFGGASPSALSNYQLFTVNGQEFMFLHLPVDPWEEEIDWAQGILDAHPDAATAVTTHRYLFDFRMDKVMGYPYLLLDARRVDAMVTTLIQPIYSENGWNAQRQFRDFISKNPQIYMVQCGHFDAEYYQVSQNDFGRPVHEMLVDFQSLPPEGGNGYMRLLRYDLETGRIQVQTYSPTLDLLRPDGEGCEFSIVLVQEFFEEYKDIIDLIADLPAIEDQIEYWTTDPAGIEEFCGILHDGGQRDSHFDFDIDFSVYRQ